MARGLSQDLETFAHGVMVHKEPSRGRWILTASTKDLPPPSRLATVFRTVGITAKWGTG